MTTALAAEESRAQSDRCEILPPQLRTEVCIETDPGSEYFSGSMRLLDKSGELMKRPLFMGSYDADKRSFTMIDLLRGDMEVKLDEIQAIEFGWIALKQSPIAQECAWQAKIVREEQKTLEIPVRQLRLKNGLLFLPLKEVAPLPTDGRGLELKKIVFDSSKNSFMIDIQHSKVQVDSACSGTSSTPLSGPSKGN